MNEISNTREPAIFIMDLDGTMMPSHEIDNDCYWAAVSDVFSVPVGALSLGGFTHITDSSILEEWCETQFGQSPTGEQINQVKQRFLQLLNAQLQEKPELFRPTKGLQEWLEIRLRKGSLLGIATGGWALTAQFKLQASGLARFVLPLASSDDSDTRVGIMLAALKRLDPSGDRKNSPVTYIGDSPWDALASRELGWDFIGIAKGDRAAILDEMGAGKVSSDFLTID